MNEGLIINNVIKGIVKTIVFFAHVRELEVELLLEYYFVELLMISENHVVVGGSSVL